jgi:regulatory protein
LATDAKRYAFKLISYRGRSENELREKLIRKGFSVDIISQTLSYLKQAGFIDDRALAESLKRQALQNRLLGYSGTKRFMLSRGLSHAIIESSLHFDEDIEIKNARKLLEKKIGGTGRVATIKEKRRLWNFLARRGYSFSTIKKALDYVTSTVKENKS